MRYMDQPMIPSWRYEAPEPFQPIIRKEISIDFPIKHRIGQRFWINSYASDEEVGYILNDKSWELLRTFLLKDYANNIFQLGVPEIIGKQHGMTEYFQELLVYDFDFIDKTGLPG